MITENWHLYLAAFGLYLCILALAAFMSPKRKELKMSRVIIEGCGARQRSDQMVCDRCGNVWDMNDSLPPDCNPMRTILGGHKPTQAFTGKGWKPMASSEMTREEREHYLNPAYYGARLEGTKVEPMDDRPSKTDWDRMEAELEAYRATEDDRDAEREAIEREATAAASKERIIAAAISIEGMTLSLPLPARHGQVLHAAINMHLADHMIHAATQGFLTSTGRFVNRVQAKQIAHLAGQPQMRPESERTKDLYSEDLW